MRYTLFDEVPVFSIAKVKAVTRAACGATTRSRRNVGRRDERRRGAGDVRSATARRRGWELGRNIPPVSSATTTIPRRLSRICRNICSCSKARVTERGSRRISRSRVPIRSRSRSMQVEPGDPDGQRVVCDLGVQLECRGDAVRRRYRGRSAAERGRSRDPRARRRSSHRTPSGIARTTARVSFSPTTWSIYCASGTHGPRSR